MVFENRMFRSVWKAYGCHFIFHACVAVYVFFTLYVILKSDTTFGLLWWPLAGAVPFVALSFLRRFWKVFLLFAVGVPVFLYAGELVFRLRYFGQEAAFDFDRFNPTNLVYVPGLLVESSDPVLGFGLRPHFRGYMKGFHLEINGDGYRDREFSTEKPDGVFRIVVVGDSVTMGSGVAAAKCYPRVLERILNTMQDQVRVEVYNLGVGGTDPMQMVRRAERDGLRFKPDLILLATITNRVKTPMVVEEIPWHDIVERNLEASGNLSFVRRYSFVANLLPDSVRNEEIRERQENAASDRNGSGKTMMEDCLEKLAVITRDHEVDVVVVALRRMFFPEDSFLSAIYDSLMRQEQEDRDRLRDLCKRYGLPFCDSIDAFPPDSRRVDLIIYPGDEHPNWKAHGIFADIISSFLMTRGFIHGVGT